LANAWIISVLFCTETEAARMIDMPGDRAEKHRSVPGSKQADE